jgi:cytochrome c
MTVAGARPGREPKQSDISLMTDIRPRIPPPFRPPQLNIGETMHRRIACLLSMAVLGAVAPAHASLALAQKNACTACHATDKKMVGPSYQDVAKKYAGQKDAVDKLKASIKAGGSGKWGPVPMPAQPNLSDADAATLAAWIMAGAK